MFPRTELTTQPLRCLRTHFKRIPAKRSYNAEDGVREIRLSDFKSIAEAVLPTFDRSGATKWEHESATMKQIQGKLSHRL